ncbi:RDD family protein [Nonomuraea sp. NPDC005983]|uniref:RDD family protein n=1 Tax=Nonomuraea sp. NPDC005983 TaxID=3155595 RepID=UPI0033BBA2C4
MAKVARAPPALWFRVSVPSGTLARMTITPQALTTTPALAARRHRLSAYLIDGLIFYVALLPVSMVGGSEESDLSGLMGLLNPYAGDSQWPLTIAVDVLFSVYFWLQHALWGQTLGKRLCGLKVVSSATGEPPGLRLAGVRALVHPTLGVVPFLGVVLTLIDMLWIFGDSKRRCLHDVVAGTVVVDVSGPGNRGFLVGLGALVALFTALVLVSVLVAR